MPHSLSAKKRVRQNVKRREVNRDVKSRIRTLRRAFAKALETRDVAAARQRLNDCQQLVHRAAVTGPLHRNAAARVISRMQSRLAAAEKASPSQ
jgi:small subunit ribosomal protein S20